MNNGGEAAEAVVKLFIDELEMVFRLTGSAAKNLAAGLYAVASNRSKTSTQGKKWLKSQVSGGSDLHGIEVQGSDAKKFVKTAKKFGLGYCAIVDNKAKADGNVCFLIRASDASRAQEICERCGINKVATADVQVESVKEKLQDIFTEAPDVGDDSDLDLDNPGGGTTPQPNAAVQGAPTQSNAGQGAPTHTTNPIEARTADDPSGLSSPSENMNRSSPTRNESGSQSGSGSSSRSAAAGTDSATQTAQDSAEAADPQAVRSTPTAPESGTVTPAAAQETMREGNAQIASDAPQQPPVVGQDAPSAGSVETPPPDSPSGRVLFSDLLEDAGVGGFDTTPQPTDAGQDAPTQPVSDTAKAKAKQKGGLGDKPLKERRSVREKLAEIKASRAAKQAAAAKEKAVKAPKAPKKRGGEAK